MNDFPGLRRIVAGLFGMSSSCALELLTPRNYDSHMEAALLADALVASTEDCAEVARVLKGAEKPERGFWEPDVSEALWVPVMAHRSECCTFPRAAPVRAGLSFWSRDSEQRRRDFRISTLRSTA